MPTTEAGAISKGLMNNFEWPILIALLTAALYAAYVIKNEKKIYIENPQTVVFHFFTFQVPLWWSVLEKTPRLIIFERTDTRYQWRSTFQWIHFAPQDQQMTVEQEFKKLLSDKNIIFDPDTTIIHGPEILRNGHQLAEKGLSFVRIEGTATQEDTDRIYYDALLIKDPHQKGLLLCESRSSILNGMLEGPYFEEAIKNIIYAQ